MPQTYAEEQIRAALKATSGHPLKTQQRIIAESRTDHRLLQELTQGHMSGIVALWVNRIARKTEDAPPPPVPKPEALNMDPGTFGKEILQALQGRDSVQFGQDTYAPRAGRKKASQAHIDAIKALASKGKSSL
ncbi:MAG: hypothetical protein KDJ15_02500 [Alphaproteobacteria bacterium]|nr:hypothetical protein [Alphaproteobacteria bacterium]